MTTLAFDNVLYISTAMHACISIGCDVHKRNIIIIIIITIISIVMCHLIATSSNLHVAAMAYYTVRQLRGHPAMRVGVCRQALVRGGRRAAAMARQWALDERLWYADDSPCWVEYHRYNGPLNQWARDVRAAAPWSASMVRATRCENARRRSRPGRPIIAVQHVLQPWVFTAQRRSSVMRAITMHARSRSR
ncbi:MAG: hypothetical protein MK074_09745 [Phycisphaerales bacterium]|nr:hypothetical protein [Phycisphaerales bacterium]